MTNPYGPIEPGGPGEGGAAAGGAGRVADVAAPPSLLGSLLLSLIAAGVAGFVGLVVPSAVQQETDLEIADWVPGLAGLLLAWVGFTLVAPPILRGVLRGRVPRSVTSPGFAALAFGIALVGAAVGGLVLGGLFLLAVIVASQFEPNAGYLALLALFPAGLGAAVGFVLTLHRVYRRTARRRPEL